MLGRKSTRSGTFGINNEKTRGKATTDFRQIAVPKKRKGIFHPKNFPN